MCNSIPSAATGAHGRSASRQIRLRTADDRLFAGGQSRIVPQPTPMGASDLDENMNLPDGLPDSSRLVAGGVYANVAPDDRLTGLRALAAKTIRDAKSGRRRSLRQGEGA